MNRVSKSLSARLSDLAALARICLTVLLVGSGNVSIAQAQEAVTLPRASAILTIDSDKLFEGSAYGRETIAEIERIGATLAAENRRIEDELTTEEKELTELRPTMTPIEFRELADAFDAKVQETRRTQDAKSRDLATQLENRRVVFLNAAAPILEQLMRDTGATVVLERRSVFISSNAVDITQIAIERLDEVLDGSDIRQSNE